ncbi:MAG: alpha/beta fold hydrolase [Pseudomonadota bacterium]|nr:alpha/beta fold hydrolase [Pseudomonadota bacterium]
MTLQTSSSHFRSNGVHCAATLHLPEGAGPFPAILMVHGWGGVQDALTVPFYAPFNQAGFAVMTFDYPGWGKSEGTPRNVINPWHRERDVENALEHLRAQPQIDASRIVLWGTSFGGGHVVKVAARHPELLAAIAQVPMLDGMAAVKAVPLMRLVRFGLSALYDLFRGKNPLFLPVVGQLGEWSSMDRDGAAEAMQKGMQALVERGGPEAGYYDNRIAARSLLTMGLYRPFKSLKDVSIPLLIVGATRDSVAPFVEGTIRALANPRIKVETLDANHFDPYFEPALTHNLGYQLAFLRGLSSS